MGSIHVCSTNSSLLCRPPVLGQTHHEVISPVPSRPYLRKQECGRGKPFKTIENKSAVWSFRQNFHSSSSEINKKCLKVLNWLPTASGVRKISPQVHPEEGEGSPEGDGQGRFQLEGLRSFSARVALTSTDVFTYS